MKTTLILALVLGACAHSSPGRFRDRAPVWSVHDTRSIPEPTKRPFYPLGHYIDGYLFDPMRAAVDPPDAPAALDINSLDEVPDSMWFENRIGMRTVTPDEVARGANLAGPPELPLAIVSAKDSGNPGFIVEDARGVRYIVKFDTAANPEQQTAGDVVANRLFWAIGYHVPADHVLKLRRGDLRPRDHTVSEATIDKVLVEATRRGDEIRAIASAFLPGKPKGGWAPTGTRADDPNDTIAHEHRRSLRGLRVFAAWLGHTDMRPDNTVDVYVSENGRQYLRHYLVDFGEAFGGHQSEHRAKEIGFEHGLDVRAQALGLVTFGLWVRDWEKQEATPWPSIGYFGAAQFDPPRWKERYPYAPFRYMDAADAYWAAKIVMRFDRRQLEAAVAEARFSDPDAAAYLVDTLLARREKIGAAYLDGVTPFDSLAIRGTSVCGADLARAFGVASAGTLLARDGATRSYETDPSGRACVPLVTDGKYHVLRLQIRRSTHTTPSMELHYVGSATPRILGVVR